MSPALAQREVALAGIALLGAILALAIASPRGPHGLGTDLKPAPVVGGEWYRALAGARPMRYGTRTKCGVLLKPSTRGVIDSVFPCNTRLYVRYRNSPEILTQVIDKRPVVPGRRFDLTPALADDLELHAIQRIEWVFPRAR